MHKIFFASITAFWILVGGLWLTGATGAADAG